MEWLFFFGLGFWVWLMWNRVDVLTRRVDELTRALNQAPRAAAAADPRGELLLDTPLPAEPSAEEPKPLWLERLADDREPLLLDTPLPPAANDEPPVLEPLQEQPRAAPSWQAPAAKRPSRSLEKWLSENGLAWLGGGALVLGGAFLVTFVAQQGFFTPMMRLGAAVLLGAALIGASEWVRRGGGRKLIDHPLAAALLAGAGASTIYAAAWAAHGVLGVIDWGWAALLLTVCSLLLLGLSLLHGQALGVLAILGAMLAPPLTSLGAWPTGALTLYVCAIGVTGFTIAALRRWAWVAGATIGGLYVWFAAAIAADDVLRALALLTFASAGGAAMGWRKPLADSADFQWKTANDYLPAAAISGSSVLLLWIWLSLSTTPDPRLDAAILVGLFHVALSAGAVRARVAHAAAFATSVGAFVFGAIAFLQARERFGPLGGDFYIWALAAAPAIGLAAFAARADRHGRTLVAGAGAIGAALMVMMAAFSRDEWAAASVWGPLFVGAILLAVAAHLAARQVAAPEKDWATDFWAGAAAALVLVGVESLSPLFARPAAIAAASALFAYVFAMRGWRGTGYAALLGAALALAHALSGDFTSAALNGVTPLWQTLAVLVTAAAALFGASYLTTPRNRDTGEALSSGGILLALLAIFHALRWVAAGGVGAPLDGFTEMALHVLTLIAAGYIALPRSEGAGVIARWRGHLMMGLGLFYALMQFGLTINPWWGAAPAAVAGPPLFNTQLLAFAAPAGLAIAAASRLYGRQLFAGRAYSAAGGVFALTWVLLEIRRGFHGAEMASAPVGLFEAHCYGLTALAFSLAVAMVSRRRDAVGADRPFTHDLSRVSRGVAVVGVVIAAVIMLLLRHPWWGAQIGATTGELSTSLSVLAQAIAMALALLLGRALSRTDRVERARFIAAAAAVVFAWSFGHAAIRWLHHRAAMDDGVALTGLEGFGHALWPLVFVLAASALTNRAPGRENARAYLYDLRSIWGAAVWPGLLWAAFGLWFVFNPWWGVAPASAATPIAAMVGLASLLLAAWFSAFAPETPHVRKAAWFAITARVACVGHLFVALSLVIRRLYQGPDMRAALEAGSLETWTYSALWAVFGAGVLGYGAVRKDAALRWSGLALLLFVTAKVFLFDMSQLQGVVRAASFIGLGAVLVIAALAARRFGGAREATPAPRD